MFDAICSSKSVARILIYVFVNGKCYGTHLAKTLKTALTPVQKALGRLEKGGILLSYYEGKTRLYQFNPACPFLNELQELLKRVFTSLPHQEKQLYCVLNRQRHISPQKGLQILLHFWDRLCRVKSITFNAKSKSKGSGWNGRGEGEVVTSHDELHRLAFQEKGSWLSHEGAKTSFSNVFRWTLDRKGGVISLEHLRYGKEHPVFLFHLVPTSQERLISVDSHFCKDDTYFGELTISPTALKLSFRVIGPKKNEEQDFIYSC